MFEMLEEQIGILASRHSGSRKLIYIEGFIVLHSSDYIRIYI